MKRGFAFIDVSVFTCDFPTFFYLGYDWLLAVSATAVAAPGAVVRLVASAAELYCAGIVNVWNLNRVYYF